MRRAVRSKGVRSQISDVHSYPAPVGGWNARDALANMPPDDAVKLVNWFPTTSDVRIRGGREDYSTGVSGTTETLAVYNALDGTSQMFAASDTGVYDVSSSGVAAVESATVTFGQFQTINFGDGTNNYLIMVNGVDDPLYYDGTNWASIDEGTSPALTGFTGNAVENLVHVNEYKGRLIFLEKDSLLNDELEIRVEKRTKALQKQVNDRKLAEALLRESEEKYRQIFENANDGILLSVDVSPTT